MTWNILAPVYYRIPKPLILTNSKKVEAQYRRTRQSRLTQQLLIMKELLPDILCVQELWFHDDVLNVFQDTLGNDYEIIVTQRPVPKQDGVALLIKKSKFTTLATDCIVYKAPHNRCMSLALVELKTDTYLDSVPSTTIPSSTSSSSSSSVFPPPLPPGQFVIGSTHLTFPAEPIDNVRRIELANFMAASITQFIDNYRTKNHSHVTMNSSPMITTILAGDMNADEDDAIKVLFQQGYISSFHTLHHRHPVFSHLDHTSTGKGVDAVYVKYPSNHPSPLIPSSSSSSVVKVPYTTVIPVEAYLIPRSSPDTEQMVRPIPQLNEDRLYHHQNTPSTSSNTNNDNDNASSIGKRKREKIKDSSTTSNTISGTTTIPSIVTDTGEKKISDPCSTNPVVVETMENENDTTIVEDNPLHDIHGILSHRLLDEALHSLEDTTNGNNEPSSALLLLTPRTIATLTTDSPLPTASITLPSPTFKTNDEVENTTHLGLFSQPRSLTDLTFTDFCHLSDHRPLWVTMKIESMHG